MVEDKILSAVELAQRYFSAEVYSTWLTLACTVAAVAMACLVTVITCQQLRDIEEYDEDEPDDDEGKTDADEGKDAAGKVEAIDETNVAEQEGTTKTGKRDGTKFISTILCLVYCILGVLAVGFLRSGHGIIVKKPAQCSMTLDEVTVDSVKEKEKSGPFEELPSTIVTVNGVEYEVPGDEYVRLQPGDKTYILYINGDCSTACSFIDSTQWELTPEWEEVMKRHEVAVVNVNGALESNIIAERKYELIEVKTNDQGNDGSDDENEEPVGNDEEPVGDSEEGVE